MRAQQTMHFLTQHMRESDHHEEFRIVISSYIAYSLISSYVAYSLISSYIAYSMISSYIAYSVMTFCSEDFKCPRHMETMHIALLTMASRKHVRNALSLETLILCDNVLTNVLIDQVPFLDISFRIWVDLHSSTSLARRVSLSAHISKQARKYGKTTLWISLSRRSYVSMM